MEYDWNEPKDKIDKEELFKTNIPIFVENMEYWLDRKNWNNRK